VSFDRYVIEMESYSDFYELRFFTDASMMY